MTNWTWLTESKTPKYKHKQGNEDKVARDDLNFNPSPDLNLNLVTSHTKCVVWIVTNSRVICKLTLSAVLILRLDIIRSNKCEHYLSEHNTFYLHLLYICCSQDDFSLHDKTLLEFFKPCCFQCIVTTQRMCRNNTSKHARICV